MFRLNETTIESRGAELLGDDSSAHLSFLRMAAEHGHVAAMYKLGLDSDDASERKYWLTEASREGHVPAMYALALAADFRNERRAWLRKAAARGHLLAMHALAAELEDPAERRQWLLRAAEEGHVPAMHDLGVASDDPAERQRWLAEAARRGCEAARSVSVTDSTVDCLAFRRAAAACSGRLHPAWGCTTHVEVLEILPSVTSARGQPSYESAQGTGT